jgi:hypothetical protein
MDTFQPVYADNLGDVNCYLFRAPTDFALTSTSGANNGSRLLFTFYGDQAINYGRIHTSVYPKQMNPNAVIYGINDTLTNLMSEAEVLNWQVNERNDIQATNVYDIKPFTYSALAYDLINHAYLQDVGWNYVGFLPITNSTPEVTSYFRQEAPNPNYASTHADLGVMAVFPNAYIVTVQREVKMYTLVNAIGFVGGVFGLLIAVQTCLFGYRPKSPWGVVHRWSIGDMKRSLLRGLQSKFKITDSGIPLVHPVHHRFSVTDLQGLDLDEPETKRINRVEERIQMLEMLFKAYYVDDEVFRSLDDASRVADEKNINAIRGHNIPSSTNAGAGGLGGYSPAATITQNEKNVNEAISSNNSVMSPSSGKSHGYPHSFSRQNTSESTSSNFPLTGGRVQHAPPYQPNTTFQMNDY